MKVSVFSFTTTVEKFIAQWDETAENGQERARARDGCCWFYCLHTRGNREKKIQLDEHCGYINCCRRQHQVNHQAEAPTIFIRCWLLASQYTNKLNRQAYSMFVQRVWTIPNFNRCWIVDAKMQIELEVIRSRRRAALNRKRNSQVIQRRYWKWSNHKFG